MIFCSKPHPQRSEKVYQLCAARVQACTGLSIVTSDLFFKNKSLCQKSTSLKSVITKLGNHSKEVLHIALSQKHEPFNPLAFQNTKSPSSCKTGQLLHFEFHLTNHLCILPQTTSNTLHTTHLNYPNHWPLTVTPFASFTISDFSLCGLTSTSLSKQAQSKQSIGEGQRKFRQGHKHLRPH